MFQALQNPPLQQLTQLAFVLHIGGGVVGLLSGTFAIVASKGGRLHRLAGNIFFVAMLIMAIFAIYLAVAMPDQLVNVFIGTFAFYLVATGWMTVRREPGTVGRFERAGLIVALVLLAPFAILSFQLATGLAPLFKSAVPFKGPVLVAIYGFTMVLATAAIGDVAVVTGGGISGAARIARHLWRMCVGLMLAAGSGFTNGLARLIPDVFDAMPLAFFLPQFIPVVLSFYWLIRVRLTGWFKQREAELANRE